MDKLVADTSAILTLYSCCNLMGKDSGTIKGKLQILSPTCVEKELENFAKHKDFLGRKSKEAMRAVEFRANPLSVDELRKEKKKLGLGKGKIGDCDLQVLHLSFEERLPFFTDEFRAHYHFSVHYPDKNIFYGVLLACKFLEGEREERIFKFIFEKLVPKRWPNISERNLMNLKIAVTEYLDL